MIKREIPAFYRQLFVLVLPIAIQNLISAMVNSVDVLMLGYVSQSAIAAVSLANQVMFILNIFITGLGSGIAMLVSQYWGKKDTRTIEHILGIALRFSVPISMLFCVAAIVLPSQIMHIFTNDTNLITLGSRYLRILGVSYVLMGFSQMYLCMMRSIERVKFSTITSVCAVLVNIILNACFIFGLLGIPKLGLIGVAFATTVARAFEVVVCVIDNQRQKEVHFHIGSLFYSEPLLFRDFLKYSLPAVANECVWGVAFLLYTVIMGHLNEDIVAANSVVTVVRDLFAVVGYGIAYGGAIILGKTIGEDAMDRAREDASRLIRVTLISGAAGAILLYLTRPLIFTMVSLSDTANVYLEQMLFISCYYLIGQLINTCLICGVFRAGGDSRYGLICDIICMWGVMVPAGFLAAFVWKLSPITVYFILCLDEFVKMPFIFYHYKKGTWLQNITRDFPEK